MSEENKKVKIGVLVGSLREGSFNRKMAHALAGLAPEHMTLEIIEFRDLPLYNPDIDGENAPQSFVSFRQSVAGMDGLLFVTPEYNRSIPGGLKNALDVGSRPYGEGVWAGKPGAVISVSPGALGAFGANHHLRQALVFLNVPAMAQPEAYIGGAAQLFDDEGAIKSEGTRNFMSDFMKAFDAWVQKHC